MSSAPRRSRTPSWTSLPSTYRRSSSYSVPMVRSPPSPPLSAESASGSTRRSERRWPEPKRRNPPSRKHRHKQKPMPSYGGKPSNARRTLRKHNRLPNGTGSARSAAQKKPSGANARRKRWPRLRRQQRNSKPGGRGGPGRRAKEAESDGRRGGRSRRHAEPRWLPFASNSPVHRARQSGGGSAPPPPQRRETAFARRPPRRSPRSARKRPRKSPL